MYLCSILFLCYANHNQMIYCAPFWWYTAFCNEVLPHFDANMHCFLHFFYVCILCSVFCFWFFFINLLKVTWTEQPKNSIAYAASKNANCLFEQNELLLKCRCCLSSSSSSCSLFVSFRFLLISFWVVGLVVVVLSVVLAIHRFDC